MKKHYGYYWYTYVKELFYNKTIVTWKPPLVKPPKWEPYFIYTKTNVFIAKKPKTKKIKKSLNPYRKKFKSKTIRSQFIKNIIPYYHFIRNIDSYFINPNYNHTISTNFTSIVKVNHPKHFLFFNNQFQHNTKTPNYYHTQYYLIPNRPIINKKATIKDFKPKFLYNPQVTRPNFRKHRVSRKVSFIFNLANNNNPPFSILTHKNLRRLRIRRIFKHFMTINYQHYKYNRLLHYNHNLFHRNQNSYLIINHLLAIINTHHLYLRPKVFPVNHSNRLRFHYLFYEPIFAKQYTILSTLTQNKHYLYPILFIIQKYPASISYPPLEHWFTQQLLVSIFQQFPLPYWSHLTHFIKNKDVLRIIFKDDQINNLKNLATGTRRNNSLYITPNHLKINKKNLSLFKTTLPYSF